MSQASPPVLTSSTRKHSVLFVPGEKFFVRRVSLGADGDPAEQVALALEGFSPFPAAQLYYGFRLNSTRSEALIFAAYRKNFTSEETINWVAADVVFPSFAAWLGAEGVPQEGISVRANEGRLEVIAWDGRSELPAAIFVRAEAAVDRDELIAEARDKAGLGLNTPAKMFSSALEVCRENRELILKVGSSGIGTRFDVINLGYADIRDKEVLNERRQTLRRDTLLWRGFSAVLIGAAACLVLELGQLATRFWMVGKQTELNARAPLVKRIDQAQSMAKRLEEISTQRLLPFEMLNVLNDKRPRSVEFTSMTTKGFWQVDIQAQATNADDPASFEADLRKLAGVEHVEVFDKRAREGTTTFRIEVTFRPGWYQAGGTT